MERELKEFIEIWNQYFNMLSIQEYEFDKYLKIINKLRDNIALDIQDKKLFIELVELMADTIYGINNCADKYETKYGTTYYQQTKIYDEPELNCCSFLLNNLESNIERDLEDEYDIAVEERYLENNKTA